MEKNPVFGEKSGDNWRKILHGYARSTGPDRLPRSLTAGPGCDKGFKVRQL
jgi:hypothetical protein